MNLEDSENGEVWRHLPESFVNGYSLLVMDAFPSLGMGSSRVAAIERASVPGHQPRLSSGSRNVVGAGGAAHGKNASAGVRGVIGSEKAMAYKATIDRKLRKLGREMKRLMGDGTLETRRCSGRCKTWADSEWLYCPRCGAPTETVT